MPRRLLVAFVDALGPRQLAELGECFEGLPNQQVLRGHLGYSSGALASVLTGAPPRVHGRMCLFSSARREGTLAPLRWLGLLPRALHERPLLRRLVARLFAKARGLEGYFALHKVPPAEFRWLDVEEREDLFRCPRVGGAMTFLERARRAGLEVYASPWQTEESARWEQTVATVTASPPDLTFVYASALDGALHAHGNGGAEPRRAARTIATQIARVRDRLSRGNADVTTVVVGDHGMADVEHVVDPRPFVARARGARIFVDSTMLRAWGSPAALAQLRAEAENRWPQAAFLDRAALADGDLPAEGAPYGEAMVVLPEGSLFAPSFVGGVARGMHGYLPAAPSAHAALLSDAALPAQTGCLTDVAGIVQRELGLAS